MALSTTLEEALNEQLNFELYSSYIYVAMSAHLASENMPGCSGWMRIQAHEELLNARKLQDYILEGALHFYIGADGSEEVTVRAGEVLHIPSNVPHKAVALEDTVDLDVFTPIRSDWLDGTDSYFHEG